MRASTLLSVLISFALAAVAVLGVRGFLADQQARIAYANTDSIPKQTIVVATQPMRFGRLIERANVKEIPWPSATLPDGAFAKIDDLVGEKGEERYVMTAIERDEPILAGKVTGPGQRATLSTALEPGMKAVSIRVNDVLGVSGFVLPGDRVDVMLTRRQGRAAEDVFTDVLLQGVRVLAIDQLADDRADKPSVVKTVTFEVSTAEAQKLTLAANVGTLSLALRNIASADVESVEPMNVNDLGGGPMSQALLMEKAGDNNDERFSTLEERIAKLAADMAKKPAEPAQKAPDRAPVMSIPSFASIGVYRDSKRTEYKVNISEE